MAGVKLTKSSLAKQRGQLKLYERLLPSLDLKRRHLLLEHEKAKAELARLEQDADSLYANIGDELPMIVSTDIDLSELVTMSGYELGQENVAGVRVPVLERIECTVAAYALLARPAWVDVLVRRLRDAAEALVRLQVSAERESTLGYAVRRVTQRVNLFDKILIPRTKADIRRIRIFLGDMERDAVVRAKLTKAR